MSPQFTHFALGYAAYLDGRPDSATKELRAALAIDPEMAAAWMQLGETYTHLLPDSGRADTLADAAFNEAMRLDSSAVHMLFHPIESRLRRGRAGEAAPLLVRFLAANPDSVLAAHVRVMDACVSKGERGVAWKDEVTAHPLAVLGAAQSLAVGGGQLDCAEAAYVAMRTFETPEMAAKDGAADNRRWTSLVGLTGVLAAEGRAGEAMAHIDSAIARKEGGVSLYLLGAPIVPAFGAKAIDAARLTTTQSGTSCERCNNDRVWQMGVWAAAAGDTASLITLAQSLSARAAGGPTYVALLSRATDARLAMLRHDTTAALSALRDVLSRPAPTAAGNLVWTESLGRGPERLALARVLFARRDYQRAIEVADMFDSPASQSYTAYLPASLALRSAAADSANMRARADEYRSRSNALGSHSTPH